MQNKTIAVIIPAYNYARYLDDCVQSVLDQTHKADEIIVVDDESTDNTKEVCDKYPVKYIWQKNKGLSGARNTGIREATSQFILCLDADDMLRPDSIKEYLELADENTIAQLGVTLFGAQTATHRPPGANYESMKRTNSVYCNSVFPKSLWEKVGGYDESETMRLGWEDYLFWFECFKAGAVLKTGEYISLLYRRHGSTMTHETTHPNLDKIKAYMKDKHPELLF